MIKKIKELQDFRADFEKMKGEDIKEEKGQSY